MYDTLLFFHKCKCGYSYRSDFGNPLGHEMITDAAVAVTCEETGLTEGKHCLICKKVLVAQKTVAKLMTDGWHKIDGKYYFYKNNKIQKGWIKANGKTYYTDSMTGILVEGFKKIDGSWYYFKTGGSGMMLTGWQKINNKWYYLEGGAMVTGTKKINGKSYTFNSSGGWVK